MSDSNIMTDMLLLSERLAEKALKEKKMKDELKLYRITIAPRPDDALVADHNELDDGCEMTVLGISGESVCDKILDEMPDSPIISASRITITEMKGPFDHGYIISYTPF